MKTNEKEVLFKTDYFDVIQKEGICGIEPHDLSVVVMPFEKDDRGLPKRIGVLKEYNPFRKDNYSVTLVTGSAEGEDPDILSTAIRELKEESGYDVSDPARWTYLGMLTASKMVAQEHPCFAVDITGLDKNEKEGDGSVAEEKSEFFLISVKEALNTSDVFIHTLFFKIFKYIFNLFETYNEEPIDKAEKLRKKLDITYLNINGVNGSLVVHDLHGDPFIEYTVTELNDDIRNIPTEIDGIKISIKTINDTHIDNEQELN